MVAPATPLSRPPEFRRMFEVESSQILAIGYDYLHCLLQVRFKNNLALYQYRNFTPVHWAQLCNAESIGKVFQQVKNHPDLFPYERIVEDDDEEEEEFIDAEDSDRSVQDGQEGEESGDEYSESEEDHSHTSGEV